MTEKATELSRVLVIGRKRDGRNCYDPEARRELVEACLRSGVSVAAMALKHGLNANMLRTWIGRYQRERNFEIGERGSKQSLPVASSAFAQVVASQPAIAKVRSSLAAKLPNGIRIELSEIGTNELSAILRLLCELPCSGSTPD